MTRNHQIDDGSANTQLILLYVQQDDGEERWANKTIQSQQTKEGEAKGGGGGTMRLLPIRGHDKVPSPPSQPPRVNDRVGTLQSLRLQTKSREGDGPTWSLRIQEKNKDGSMVNNTVKESNAYSYTRNSKGKVGI